MTFFPIVGLYMKRPSLCLRAEKIVFELTDAYKEKKVFENFSLTVPKTAIMSLAATGNEVKVANLKLGPKRCYNAPHWQREL